jgi:hypothetical protein
MSLPVSKVEQAADIGQLFRPVTHHRSGNGGPMVDAVTNA